MDLLQNSKPAGRHALRRKRKGSRGRVLMASAEQKVREVKVEKVEGEAEGGDPGGDVGREGEGGGDAALREAATSRGRWRLAVATVAMGSGEGKPWRWWRR